MNFDNNSSEIENELKKLGYWNNLYTKNDYFGTGQTILANFARDVIEKNSIKISIEAGSILGWERYVGVEGISLGMKSFGKTAPHKELYEHFNLTSDNIVKLARKMLRK